MTMITLAKVKLYCRIDVQDDDTLLNSLMAAAEALIKQQSGKNAYIGDGSITPVNIRDTDLFETCVCQLVEHWYDRRGAADTVQFNDIPFATDMLIAHFKYSCEYAMLDPEPELQPGPEPEPEPDPEPTPEPTPEQEEQNDI